MANGDQLQMDPALPRSAMQSEQCSHVSAPTPETFPRHDPDSTSFCSTPSQLAQLQPDAGHPPATYSLPPANLTLALYTFPPYGLIGFLPHFLLVTLPR